MIVFSKFGNQETSKKLRNLPDPKESNVAVLKKTEGYGLTEAGLRANKCP